MDLDPLPHLVHEGIMQHPEHPQNSFNLSGSTAAFYKGSGLAIHLSVEQILQGSMANASSSVSSDEVTSQPLSATLDVLSVDFRATNLSFSLLVQSLFSARSWPRLNLKRNWDFAFANSEDLSKAIVPVHPVLHVIVLHV